MKNGEFEIRDSRNKNFYMVDNEYLNGYARLCGWKATLAYDSLCRHANIKNQESFPSINTMAKELAVARNTIIAGIKSLVEWNIVAIKETRGRNNVYILLDKTQWKSKPNQFTTRTSSPREPVHHMDWGSSPQGLDQFTTRTPTILKNNTKKEKEILGDSPQTPEKANQTQALTKPEPKEYRFTPDELLLAGIQTNPDGSNYRIDQWGKYQEVLIPPKALEDMTGKELRAWTLANL